MGISKVTLNGVTQMDISDTTATASDVLSPKKFYGADGEAVTGSIQSKAASTYTPTTTDQTIAASQYLTGAQTIKGDANLVAGNIKKDTTIFGVTGTLEGIPEAPTVPSDAIIFYAEKPFAIHVDNRTKNWNGTISYSTDYSTWSTWDGTTILNAVQSGDWYKIYMKGSSNTYITGVQTASSVQTVDRDQNRRWVITNTGDDVVMCKGNFTKLLGRTSINTAGCFANMFKGNAYLDFDITLPTTGSYAAAFACMFEGCSSMTKAPDIVSTSNIQALTCYGTFRGCSKLKHPPTIAVATKTVGNYGFAWAFENCTALEETITLDYTVASYGCNYMFAYCHSLKTVDLSNLASSNTFAFQYMFRECTSLKSITGLPTASLHGYAFEYTFQKCHNLKNIAPSVMTALYTASYVWDGMFQYCTSLESTGYIYLKVASGTGTKGAYICRNMYQYCYALNDAYGLTLDDSLCANYAFQNMFQACSSLVTPPELPYSPTIYTYMYNQMFYSCTSLTTASTFRAATVNSYGCANMYYGCTSLTKAPALPMHTFDSTYCYYQMFKGCTNLESIPELRVTTLKGNCYREMFSGCSKIKVSTTQTGEYQTAYRIPSTGTGTTASDALTNMFTNTGGTLTGTPTINTTYYVANEVVSWDADSNIRFTSSAPFSVSTGSSVGLQYSSDRKTWNNVSGGSTTAVQVSGTYQLFFRSASIQNMNQFYLTANGDVYCDGNIETVRGWDSVAVGIHPDFTVEGARGYGWMFETQESLVSAPYIPTTSFPAVDGDGYGFYQEMFYACTSLTKAPKLPALTIPDGNLDAESGAYGRMFAGCISLVEVPPLQATSVGDLGYSGMFLNCTSLVDAPEISATIVGIGSFYEMFNGCTSLTNVPTPLYASTAEELCYYGMFQGCISLATLPSILATTFGDSSCVGMFAGCESIKLSATQTGEYQTAYRIPISGTATAESNSFEAMFEDTGGTLASDPVVNTTYYTSNAIIS